MLLNFVARTWVVFAMVLASVSLVELNTNPLLADEKVDVTGGGTGIFCFDNGYFFGSGDGTLGKNHFYGHIAMQPIDQLNFMFENKGRGTKDETFQEMIAVDGSSLSFRFQGIVSLIPLDKLGNFSAVWEGDWEVVRGTGRFRNAKGTLEVVAINEPFNIVTESEWAFNWDWEGILKQKKNATKHYLHFQTGGHGVFDPANIGVVNPLDPTQFIIGDGSGLGVYDGTPTGNEFRLNGQLVGDGFDQHFGSAQSLTAGIFHVDRFFFPGETGLNPDGSGRRIHVMKTNDGEIWFRNNYYFELEPGAGTLTGNCDFRVVGGTQRFRKASGSVFCQVVTMLGDVTVDNEGDVNAPFRYDFNGFIDLQGN